MEISRNLSKQPFPTDSGRITPKNSLRDYVHLSKSPDFRLLVLKCAGSYLRVFTVYYLWSINPVMGSYINFRTPWDFASCQQR